jgi:ATP-dependent protease ClpP protease subunit
MFKIEAKDNNSEYTLFLYGTIDRWGDVKATDVTSLLNKAVSGGAKKINLRVHSSGGSVFEAFAIYEAIKGVVNKGIEVVAFVDGIAASMMSVVIQAASKVVIGKTARIMTHQSRVVTSGTSKQLRDAAELLDSINEQFAEIYASKAGKDVKWVEENWLLSDKDVWHTAEEAVKNGLASEVSSGAKVVVPSGLSFEKIVACYDSVFATEIGGESPNSSYLKNPKNMENFSLPKSKVWALLAGFGIAPEVQAGLDDQSVLFVLEEKAKQHKALQDEFATLKATASKRERDELTAMLQARGCDASTQQKYLDAHEKMGFEATVSLLSSIPVVNDLTAVQGGGAAFNGGKRDWRAVSKTSVANGLTAQEMAVKDPEYTGRKTVGDLLPV